MNAHQPRTTPSYGYDNTCSSFQGAGMPIFGYDPSADSLTAPNLEASAGNVPEFRRFTGKERDAESGLDYFGARYYGGALGRWTSPDWSEKPQPIPYADLHNPQTLNLYAYVHNNPLGSPDLDGHADCGGEKDHSWWFCLKNWAGLNETDTQKADIARTYFELSPSRDSQGNLIDPAKMSNAEVIKAFHDLTWERVRQLTVEAIASAPEKYVSLTDVRATGHTLYGDSTGGGHLAGVGKPGKTEFPADWSAEKVLHEISDVASDPNSRTYKQGSVTVIEGRREGVDIRVVERGNRIVTGYPTNLPKNP